MQKRLRQRLRLRRKRIWFTSWRIKVLQASNANLKSALVEKSEEASMWEDSAIALRENNENLKAELERLKKRLAEAENEDFQREQNKTMLEAASSGSLDIIPAPLFFVWLYSWIVAGT